MQKKYLDSVTAKENEMELLIKEHAAKIEMQKVGKKKCYFFHCDFSPLFTTYPDADRRFKNLVLEKRFEVSYSMVMRLTKTQITKVDNHKGKEPRDLPPWFIQELKNQVNRYRSEFMKSFCLYSSTNIIGPVYKFTMCSNNKDVSTIYGEYASLQDDFSHEPWALDYVTGVESVGGTEELYVGYGKRNKNDSASSNSNRPPDKGEGSFHFRNPLFCEENSKRLCAKGSIVNLFYPI